MPATACALSPLPAEVTRRLLLFFAAIHDVGKFAPGFQGKASELARSLGCVHAPGDTVSHCDYGGMAWIRWLRDHREHPHLRGDMVGDILHPLATAALAHHGQPTLNLDADSRAKALFKNNWPHAVAHMRRCARLFLPEAPLPADMEEHSLRPLSWFAAGLFIVADWLGSNERWFPHSCSMPTPCAAPNSGTPDVAVPRIAAPDMASPDLAASASHATCSAPSPASRNAPLAPPDAAFDDEVTAQYRAYFDAACARARTALRQSELIAPPPLATPAFGTLFPKLTGHTPHPLQRAAADVALADGPQLFILEDLTGGGKTEAALLLASRLMAAGHASGVFIGLPTQATANAMYERLRETAPRIFPDSDAITLLAHGGRDLHAGFLASIARPADATGHTAHNGKRDTPEDDNRATCTPWLADNRKKALLAPCGAGTLDQALLGVLPSRHQALRLLGLSRSVLIADEIHAFDSYTNKLIQTLLTFHAALGGSAILLSATLPRRMRAEFMAAFHQGRILARCATTAEGYSPWAEYPPGPEPVRQDFPLITHQWDAPTPLELPVPPSSRTLHVAVELHATPAPLLDALRAAHAAGGCGAWVRNTVDDVLEARRMLIEQAGIPAEDVLIFHARFAGCDRQRIEQRVLSLFGPESTAAQRRGKILVASQVIEQSIDLDFDVLCSDLAPMELLIQRAGRCHRHRRKERPAALSEPRMLILSPDPQEGPDTQWYARLLPRAQYVYGNTPVLWRTAVLLRHYGAFRLPELARTLVEGAYANADTQDTPDAGADANPALAVPPAITAAGLKYEGEATAKRSMGRYNRLVFEAGYNRDASENRWDSDVRTPTRLGEATVALRLLRKEAGGLRLWADTAATPQPPSMELCLRSEVKVAAWRAKEALCPPGMKDELAALALRMADGGLWALLLPLTPTDNGQWRGTLLREDDKRLTVIYDACTGLQYAVED